jgi:hypothetical protein
MAETSRRKFLKGAMAIGTAASLPDIDAQAATTSDHEAFIRLSFTLTGLSETELPVMVEQQDAAGVRVKLYEIYFERLRLAYPTEFRELLTTWRTVEDKPDPELAISQKLTAAGPAAERLRIAGRQVVKIWYLSTIDDPRIPLDPKKKGKNAGQVGGDLGQYENSAIWKLIGAPVPGYSNFSHGYWVDKPMIGLARGSTDLLDYETNTSVELPDG